LRIKHAKKFLLLKPQISKTEKSRFMLPIYVDFDDVFSDTTCAFLEILEVEFGKRVNFEDIFSFDLQASFGLGESEFEHFFQ